MHELGPRIAGLDHHVGIHLIGRKQLDPFRPFFLGLAHRHPDIGVDEVGACHGGVNILGQRDPRAGFGGDGIGLVTDLRIGPQAFGRAQAHIHAHLRPADQQAVTHVVARIAHEAIGDLAQRLVGMFLHGQEIGKDLRRVEFVRQPVIDGHASVLRQRLDDRVTKSAIFDRVIDPA